jgi:hypothetical protein
MSFDLLTHTWTAHPFLPLQFNPSAETDGVMASAVWRSCLFILHESGDFSSLDPDLNEWTQLMSIARDRNDAMLATTSSGLWMFGGASYRNRTGDQGAWQPERVDFYDPTSNQWQTAAWVLPAEITLICASMGSNLQCNGDEWFFLHGQEQGCVWRMDMRGVTFNQRVAPTAIAHTAPPPVELFHLAPQHTLLLV